MGAEASNPQMETEAEFSLLVDALAQKVGPLILTECVSASIDPVTQICKRTPSFHCRWMARHRKADH